MKRARGSKEAARDARVGLVEDDDLVSSRWESHLSLRKALDLVSDHVDSSAWRLAVIEYEREARGTDLSSEALSSSTPSL